MPDDGAGQLDWHWLSDVHLATQTFAGGSFFGSSFVEDGGIVEVDFDASGWGAGGGSAVNSSSEEAHATAMRRAAKERPMVANVALRTMLVVMHCRAGFGQERFDTRIRRGT